MPAHRGAFDGGRISRLVRLFGVVPDAMGLTWLWLLGVLAGAGLLGAGPATAAASALALARLRGEDGHPWRRFWTEWRAAFVPANVAALPLVVVALVAALNLDAALAGAVGAWSLPVAGVALLVTAGAALWLAPMRAYYDLPALRQPLAALRLVVLKPAPTAVMVGVTAAVAVATAKLPVLLVLVAPGAWIAALTGVAVGAFDHNEAALAQGTETRGEPLGLPQEPLRIR